jgi:mono/diheme cytochrome c family protein
MIRVAVTLLLFTFAAGCSGEDSAAVDAEFASILNSVSLPEELDTGERLFNANCSTCHGQLALGTDRGPPLVHITYEPSHHADMAFVVAAQRGVRAHHWQFGDMPPVPSVNRDQIDSIVAYIRYLQREVGIF